jgi:hypothetical protein
MVARKSIQKPFRKKAVRKPLKRARMVPTKALTNAIQKITFKNMETKTKQVNLVENQSILGNGLQYDFANDTYNGGGGKANVLSMAANLAAGTADNQRIGNEITPVSLVLKGFVKCLPYDNTTNTNRTPFDVYMVIYKKKNEPEGATDKMISYNDGTKGVITGSITTTVLNPWNRDNYIIKKVVKFPMKSQPYITISPLGGDQKGATVENNESSLSSTRDYFRTFTVPVKLSKKILRYNSSSQSAPTNDWFGVGFYYINGDATATSAISASQIRAQVTMQSILKYKDA